MTTIIDHSVELAGRCTNESIDRLEDLRTAIGEHLDDERSLASDLTAAAGRRAADLADAFARATDHRLGL